MPRSKVSVDTANYRLPVPVVARLAADAADPGTVLGAVISDAGGGGGGTVFYGSTASTPRPVSAQPIVWVGNTGVVPVNAEENDLIFTAEPGTVPDPDPENNAPTVVLSVSAAELTATATWVTSDLDSDPVTATNINWGDGTATVINPTSGVTHLYGEAGTFTVTLTVSDGTDQGVDTDDITVTAPTPPGPATYSVNFTADTLSAAPPNWTQDVYSTGNPLQFTVIADPSDGADKALRTSKASGGTARAVCKWNTPVSALTEADVEVLYRWRSDFNGAARFLILGRGTPGVETGAYVYYLNNTNLQVTQWIDGVSSSLGTLPVATWVSGTWYRTRIRTEAGQIKVKHWLDTDTEPGAWGGTFNLPPELLVPGFMGTVIQVNTSAAIYDWISAGTGGLTAPTI